MRPTGSGSTPTPNSYPTGSSSASARSPPPLTVTRSGSCRDGCGPGPGLSSPERGDQLGKHLVHVADDAEVGDAEDRSLLVLVDGDDRRRVLHPDEVLHRPADAAADAHGRLHGLAGLA